MQRDFYLDTEFSEGFRKPIWWLPSIFGFNKKRWFIELISIGIVCADGRVYYAISKEFKRRHANPWVRENVIAKLPRKYDYEAVDMPDHITGTYYNVVKTLNPLYKSNRAIANEIIMFCHYGGPEVVTAKFYAYYADYDWVLFCTLFGTMVQLPKGFPMYCVDLKQEIDNLVDDYGVTLKALKNRPEYPTQENEHNAADDALFNWKLHNFINWFKSNIKNSKSW